MYCFFALANASFEKIKKNIIDTSEGIIKEATLTLIYISHKKEIISMFKEKYEIERIV